MTDRVTLRFKGRLGERFLARALEKGISLQSALREQDGDMTLLATDKNARRLMDLAREYGANLTVVKREGWPLWRGRWREGSALGTGLMLGLWLALMFTAQIWRVEAVSLDGATPEATLRAVEKALDEWGAGPGARRAGVDREDLEIRIQDQWPELTYVSVKTSGVSLRAEVAMEDAAPKVYDLLASRDLVASRDAVIVRVEALAGKAAVKSGDTVRRGQTLIRGEERIDRENTRGVRALGRVTARGWFEAESQAPLSRTLLERTGQTRVSARVRLGQWQWTMEQAEPFECQEEEMETLPIGGLFLPVRVERKILFEARQRQEEEDMEALRARLEAEALGLARRKLPEGAEETASWVDFDMREGTLRARATVEALMDIAVSRSGEAGTQ